MNQREFTALGAAELDPMAVVLYVRAFRRYMDFKTGESALSLSRLAQELEYQPPACSRRGKVESVSTKRVRTLITHLVDAGLLVLVRPGNAARKAPAVYRCELATTDQKRSNSPSLTQIRPNEEGHIADTVQGHIDGHSKSPENKGLESKQGHIDGHSQNFNEGHISERSELNNSLSNAREKNSPELTTGAELEFNQEFLAIAGLTGLKNSDPEYIEDVFNHFRFYPKHQNTLRNHAQWKSEWRSWVAREKLYGGKYATKANSKPHVMHSRENQNPTAKLYRRIQKRHDEFASSDEGKAYFEGQDDFE